MLRRYADILESWKGTKYLDGHSQKGVGVDCVNFVDRVWNELWDMKFPTLPEYPPQVSLHNPHIVVRVGLIMRNRYPIYRIRDPKGFDECPPGTALVGMLKRSGRKWPGHAMLVGPDGKSIWHSIEGSGVAQIGDFAQRWNIARAWVPKEKLCLQD